VPHFAQLPPEINSALIFAGAGAAPMFAAAAAWDSLAEDLASSASSFGSVTSDLISNSWQGPSSAAMMAVATQYVGWLSAAAAQAEASSSQAGAIAAAFESAVVATVQPAVVTANRALVQVLAATNWFGLNAPAIMDTESAYEQMWAADVAAMFGYHAGASEAVSQLSPWQAIMHDLGFKVDSNGHLTMSTPGNNTSVGSASSGSASGESSSNVGLGNTGSQNVGFGNAGNNNFGFGNTGNNDFGIGLTGNNQFGIGNFSTGNFLPGGGFGIGNSGSVTSGLANSASASSGGLSNGAANPGFSQDSAFGTHGMLPSHYVTGGFGAANLSSGLLNSSTGGLTASLGSPDVLNPAAFAGPVNAAASVDSGGVNANLVSATNGPTPAVGPRAGATSQSGLLNSGNADSGFRSPATRDSGIPSSGFFNRGESDLVPDAGTIEPVSPD
jgi:PPE-repeat protein